MGKSPVTVSENPPLPVEVLVGQLGVEFVKNFFLILKWRKPFATFDGCSTLAWKASFDRLGKRNTMAFALSWVAPMKLLYEDCCHWGLGAWRVPHRAPWEFGKIARTLVVPIWSAWISDVPWRKSRLRIWFCRLPLVSRCAWSLCSRYYDFGWVHNDRFR